MGQLISLTERLAERAAERARPTQDLAAADHPRVPAGTDGPVSYLVAERVERDLGEINWVAMLSLDAPEPWAHERLRRAREEAVSYRLPLLEPEHYPSDVRPVTRAAAYAALQGAGSRFALAAMRLAFAGGFDLAEPESIAEAALAVDLDPDAVLVASRHPGYDNSLGVTARGLRTFGILSGPALRICGGWFTGFDALSQTSEFTAARASYHRLPRRLA